MSSIVGEVPACGQTLQLHLTGEAVIANGQTVLHRLERRDAALLAVLALQGPQPRTRLASWLWPDAPAGQAANNLRQRLFRLRRRAGRALVEGSATLRLADDLAHDLQPALPTAGVALPELLAGHDYDDCAALAERVDALRGAWRLSLTDALTTRAQSEEDAGQLEQAHQTAGVLLSHLPHSEEAHARVARLRYLMGDTTGALATLEACTRMVQRQFGLPASASTAALARLVRSATVPVARRPLDLALARPPRLVGRDGEWARLQAAWQPGSRVVVRGEAGIGKTRLMHDFVQAHGPAVWIKLTPADQRQPFALLSRLLTAARGQLPDPPAWASADLARIVPSLGAAPTGPMEPGPFRRAVQAALAGWTASNPGALVIDDLQWADAASLEHLFRWCDEARPDSPPMVMLLRSDEPLPGLEAWLDAQPLGRALDLSLRALPVKAVAELIRSVTPDLETGQPISLARRLVDRVGGHPFRLLEMLRQMAAAGSEADAPAALPAGSDSLLAMIARRLSRLPQGPLRLLRVAGIAGASFSVELAAEALQRHEIDLIDDWQHLIEAQLMQAGGPLFDVVCEAVLQGIPEPIAKALHVRVATALQGRAAAPETVAAHWLAAERWADAAPQFEQAARAAGRLMRRVEELAFWDQAADAHDRAGATAAAWAARYRAADAARHVDSGPEVLVRADRLRDSASTADRLPALLLRAQVLLDIDEGLAVVDAQAALAAAESLGDRPRRLQAAATLGLALASSGRVDEGLAVLDRHAADAAALDDDRTALVFESFHGHALQQAGRFAQAFGHLETALGLAEMLGDLGEAHNVAGVLVVNETHGGRLDRAMAAGDRALQLWRRMGEPRSLLAMSVHVNLGLACTYAGRFDRALDLLQPALAHFRAAGPPEWRAVAEQRLCTTWLRLGQFARARQALSPLPDEAAPDRVVGRLMQLWQIDQAAGRARVQTLQAAHDRHGPDLLPQNRLSLELLLARHLPPEQALVLATRLCQQTDRPGQRTNQMAARLALADARRQLGHGREAAAEARRAWQLAAEGTGPHAFVALCWTVHLCAEAGADASTADAALQAGADWLQRALAAVPAPFQSSFLERQAAHRLLLARARQRRPDALAQPQHQPIDEGRR